MSQRILGLMGDAPLTPQQQTKLQLALARVESEVEAISRANPVRVDIEKAWREFLLDSEFKMTLWKSEEVAYVGVYYAYEVFVTRCVGLALGKPAYRRDKAKSFPSDLVSAIENNLHDRCWSDEPVAIARLTRNAIVHNGGKLTDELRKRKHGFALVGDHQDEVAITAHDTTALYHTLKGGALALVQYAVKLPRATQ